MIFATTTPYQRLVVTRWKDDTRLYINGNLQFSSRDEHRYHEALVHPALQSLPRARRALVLGGGDGLAVREILRHANIQQVTLVDLDPAMTDLFSRNAELVALNAGALKDPRVKVINADAGQWLETNTEVFDLIVADFPDPSSFGLGKLYSVPIYRLMARHLAENGAPGGAIHLAVVRPPRASGASTPPCARPASAPTPTTRKCPRLANGASTSP